MIMGDGKKIMTILLAKRRSKDAPRELLPGMQNESVSPEHAATHSAAEDLITAIHDKSAIKAADALRSFMAPPKES